MLDNIPKKSQRIVDASQYATIDQVTSYISDPSYEIIAITFIRDGVEVVSLYAEQACVTFDQVSLIGNIPKNGNAEVYGVVILRHNGSNHIAASICYVSGDTILLAPNLLLYTFDKDFDFDIDRVITARAKTLCKYNMPTAGNINGFKVNMYADANRYKLGIIKTQAILTKNN